MVTKQEQLDELLAMARECGRLSNELDRWEKDCQYAANSWRGKNGRYFFRKTRDELDRATKNFEKSRARFLNRLDNSPTL